MREYGGCEESRLHRMCRHLVCPGWFGVQPDKRVEVKRHSGNSVMVGVCRVTFYVVGCREPFACAHRIASRRTQTEALATVRLCGGRNVVVAQTKSIGHHHYRMSVMMSLHVFAHISVSPGDFKSPTWPHSFTVGRMLEKCPHWPAYRKTVYSEWLADPLSNGWWQTYETNAN